MPPQRITDFFSPSPKKQKTSETGQVDDQELVQLSTTISSEEKNDEKTEESAKEQTTDKVAETNTEPRAYTFETLEDGLPDDWKAALAGEFVKPYWKQLKQKLIAERDAKKQIFPPVEDLFTAFWASPLNSIRVFICGQDPYHDDNQAMGLAFSVRKTLKKIPPSLVNIYKELATDIPGFVKPSHGDLSPWAKQGVFLLNTALTVRAHEAKSHIDFGWLQFTDAVVKVLTTKKNLVWILWGAPAAMKAKGVDTKNNCVLKAVHPSPLSASKGFFGSKHFSKTNAYLTKLGFKPINWQV
jgi:uracil-DNA glycosylase